MKCPQCKKGKIKIKEIYIDGKKYLQERCTLCEYYDKIYLHKYANGGEIKDIKNV
jgi:hypothetical protein